MRSTTFRGISASTKGLGIGKKEPHASALRCYILRSTAGVLCLCYRQDFYRKSVFETKYLFTMNDMDLRLLVRLEQAEVESRCRRARSTHEKRGFTPPSNVAGEPIVMIGNSSPNKNSSRAKYNIPVCFGSCNIEQSRRIRLDINLHHQSGGKC